MRVCLIAVVTVFVGCVHRGPPSARTDAAPGVWNEQPLAPSALTHEVESNAEGAASKFRRRLTRVRGVIAALQDSAGNTVALADEGAVTGSNTNVLCAVFPPDRGRRLQVGQVVSVVGVAEVKPPASVLLRRCELDDPSADGPAVAHWDEANVAPSFAAESNVDAEELAHAYSDPANVTDANARFGSRLLLVTGPIRRGTGSSPLSLEGGEFGKSITCDGVYTWMALDQVDAKRPIVIRGVVDQVTLTGVTLRQCEVIGSAP